MKIIAQGRFWTPLLWKLNLFLWNFRTFDNDIAILTFEEDVQFKSAIRPICLPSKTPRLLQEKFVQKGVYITGWGATSFRGKILTVFLGAKE